METIKKALLVVGVLFVLPGCLFQDNGETKKSKKTALADEGKGIPLAGLTRDEGKFFDSQVEAFVLDETTDEELADFDATREMQLARADIDQEPVWKEDLSFDQQNFETIYFDFDKHEIREDQRATLAFDLEQAKEAIKEGSLAIEGHSDSHFVSELYNIAKSEKRARAIAAELQRVGIPQDKIKVVGYGDKKKAVDAPGKEERNRRAEIIRLTETA